MVYLSMVNIVKYTVKYIPSLGGDIKLNRHWGQSLIKIKNEGFNEL